VPPEIGHATSGDADDIPPARSAEQAGGKRGADPGGACNRGRAAALGKLDRASVAEAREWDVV
jgi:hypothetical protein